MKAMEAEKVTRDLNLPLTYPSDSFILPETVLPRTDHTADLYVESSKNISVTKGDSILFPLKVEPESSLTIEKWAGDVNGLIRETPDDLFCL